MNANNTIEEPPFFSIIIPAYNVEKYITQCLESLLNQTFPSLEIIVVDDGSLDRTFLQAEKISKLDGRIKTIKKNENQSQLSARIDGMKQAVGKYVLFVDSDDFCAPEMCEVLRNEIEKAGADIIAFAYDHYPDNSRVVNSESLNHDSIIRIMKREMPHTLWNKCYSNNLKNKVLEHIKPFYCNMSEDAYFSILFFFFANSYSKTDRILYHYRIGSGLSTGKSINEEKLQKMLDSTLIKDEYLREFFRKNQPKYLPYVEVGEKKDLAYIVDLCKKTNETEEQKNNLLRLMDERLHTEFCTEYFIEKGQFQQARKQSKSYGVIRMVRYYAKYKLRKLKHFLMEKNERREK